MALTSPFRVESDCWASKYYQILKNPRDINTIGWLYIHYYPYRKSLDCVWTLNYWIIPHFLFQLPKSEPKSEPWQSRNPNRNLGKVGTQVGTLAKLEPQLESGSILNPSRNMNLNPSRNMNLNQVGTKSEPRSHPKSEPRSHPKSEPRSHPKSEPRSEPSWNLSRNL